MKYKNGDVVVLVDYYNDGDMTAFDSGELMLGNKYIVTYDNWTVEDNDAWTIDVKGTNYCFSRNMVVLYERDGIVYKQNDPCYIDPCEYSIATESSVTTESSAVEEYIPTHILVPILKRRNKARNKYDREIVPGVFVDVYDVLYAFGVEDSALQHLIKKALAVGKRGHKDKLEDYEDILSSAKRALEQHEEWQKQDNAI